MSKETNRICFGEKSNPSSEIEGYVTDWDKKEEREPQFGSKTSKNLSQDILKILQLNNFLKKINSLSKLKISTCFGVFLTTIYGSL